MLAIHQSTCLMLCLGLSGIAVGLGARLPNLREQSPSRIAAGLRRHAQPGRQHALHPGDRGGDGAAVPFLLRARRRPRQACCRMRVQAWLWWLRTWISAERSAACCWAWRRRSAPARVFGRFAGRSFKGVPCKAWSWRRGGGWRLDAFPNPSGAISWRNFPLTELILEESPAKCLTRISMRGQWWSVFHRDPVMRQRPHPDWRTSRA